MIPFRIGTMEDPEVVSFRHAISARGRSTEAPIIAVGDQATIVSTFRQYIDAGISKFVAIPLASNPQDLKVQVRRLAEEICPRIQSTK